MSGSKRRIVIYTDGSCKGNPGAGGWAAILRSYRGRRLLKRKTISGHEAFTTNSRMEMTAAISALECLREKAGRPVILYTDSQYLSRGITEWLPAWKRRGWKTASKSPVKDADLWKRLEKLAALHVVDWRWIKGHDGNRFNEEADMLAQIEAAAIS